MKILMVLTSHDQLGDSGEKTGFWAEEFAAPYYLLKEAGADITLASPAGGPAPVDPKSEQADAQTEATRRLAADPAAKQLLAETLPLDQVSADRFDGLFYPGGHGPLWDLKSDSHSIALIENFLARHKPVAAVCHAPAVLLEARKENGEPLLRGLKVTGFSNSEERAVGLDAVVPYLLEDELKARGALYEKAPDWQSFMVQDGRLITGQNPASSELVAEALLLQLQD
ncbi:type 1 glutamine amidotransferase domain-containing protein [Marinobacterium arenosum]|uniref:type 1 glutamine amidotransferase domain-containing protein n=1 Tax=Marinobacterium arenosum TaxID=2862496 RepID=UPI001C944C64|nr:type 1 glutamine amidotransferase domain-containing protein [Marinobacterium arenosum]MBY4677626.1 type 1 glutamine amidotransferase domain-containing protein [Marinobacterium arenosum]